MKPREYLENCRELAQLCSQNGWIDNTTLQADLVRESEHSMLASVTFEEVMMEGAGCVAGRKQCYGKLALQLDAAGHVTQAKVI